MKETYYGYELPGTPDWDYNSWMGIGDHSNDLIPGYSAALSESARQVLFGKMSRYSTGKEFTFNGKTYRDDDTSPQPFANVDIYSPGGVPGSANYNPNQVTPIGKMSGQSLVSVPPVPNVQDAPPPPSSGSGDTPTDKFKKAYPQFASVDFSKIMERVREIHPTMDPIRLEELMKTSGGWDQLMKESKQSNVAYTKSFPELKKFFEGGGQDAGSSSGSGSEQD